LALGDYPALHLRRCGARSLSPEEVAQASGLLRWILRELAEWAHERDPRLEKVAAMLVLLNEFDWKMHSGRRFRTQP